MRRQLRWRMLIMALALVALLGAAWGGLLRLGWNWPLLWPPLPAMHGPMLVSGFLGTLIGLERAVALDRRWTYSAPVLSGIGALLLLMDIPSLIGQTSIMLSSVVLVAIFVVLLHHQPALFIAVMALGSVAWLSGNALWLAGWAIPHVVLCWIGFLVITIVGERLELSRLVRLTRWRYTTFFGALGAFVSGMLLSVWWFDAGMRLGGLGMIGLAIWLARYDIARRTVRKTGLTRFIAVALLAGYVWLGIGGLLALVFGGVTGGFVYDALLHAVFLGFVISMVFGHAPIIFPALFRLSLFYDRIFYTHLVLLHASLAVRVGGDLAGWSDLRRVGGLFNVVAILLFFTNTVRVSRKTLRTRQEGSIGASAAEQRSGNVSRAAR